MKVNPEKLRALVSLLADEDRSIAATAEEKLLELGTDVIPDLKQFAEDQPLSSKLRVREIVQRLEAVNLEDEFRHLPTTPHGQPQLEPALFTIARIGKPTLHPEPYEKQLDRFSARVQLELNRWESPDPRTIVDTVAGVLFDRLGFEGNRDDYYNPENSYIHRVLTTRQGIPISLSALVLVIGERLNLPFRGVGMPAHFIVRFPGTRDPIFMDPFNRGKLLNRDECIDLLNRAGFRFVPEFLEPVDNKAIVQRALRNLAKVFSRNDQPDQINRIRAYMAIVNRTY